MGREAAPSPFTGAPSVGCSWRHGCPCAAGEDKEGKGMPLQKDGLGSPLNPS